MKCGYSKFSTGVPGDAGYDAAGGCDSCPGEGREEGGDAAVQAGDGGGGVGWRHSI